MPSKPWKRGSIRQRLADMLVELEDVRAFTAGITFDRFFEDRMRQHAVLHALQILSEAASQLDRLERQADMANPVGSLTARYSNIRWAEIFALANVYRHDYGAIDLREVWDTATSDELGELESMLREELPIAFEDHGTNNSDRPES